MQNAIHLFYLSFIRSPPLFFFFFFCNFCIRFFNRTRNVNTPGIHRRFSFVWFNWQILNLIYKISYVFVFVFVVNTFWSMWIAINLIWYSGVILPITYLLVERCVWCFFKTYSNCVVRFVHIFMHHTNHAHFHRNASIAFSRFWFNQFVFKSFAFFVLAKCGQVEWKKNSVPEQCCTLRLGVIALTWFWHTLHSVNLFHVLCEYFNANEFNPWHFLFNRP